MRRLFPLLILSMLLLASSAAFADGPSRKQRTALENTQNAYGATIRWGSMDDAIGYLDPRQRKENPPTEFELERYAQLRVSSYRERSSAALPDGVVERRVEIGVINVNTQAERLVVVVERWRWDPEAKRWWQTAGLPDLWRGQ
ncbi:hypothetical protein [Stenotrophomonas sp. 24(2023)]|uniref:hypothetical protein n=1 Tax=Stenotrophomonas sp. 24(2023) TaxID=3068324 RepID=UPI0027E026FB|nr:hypothetical protein [Stenotrophomonas sp. 24(2023)]WMJ71212.1 hypothetical protein Q9R17_09005 [Stenotrophomonas sp. 24(2023)]